MNALLLGSLAVYLTARATYELGKDRGYAEARYVFLP